MIEPPVLETISIFPRSKLPGTQSFQLALTATLLASDSSCPLVGVAEMATSSPRIDIATPGVISVPFAPATIKTFSYRFASAANVFPSNAVDPATPDGTVHARAPGNRRPVSRRSTTRIKPPGDIVKLQDRLFYALQPPLETWLETESLEFAFEPFPFQLEGVAFLYPRYAAVLADEMGLGKTMQAITTVRLLLHTGEIRSVLIVCPKPLVTNWQREFSVWAPEVPVTLVEGDCTRRHWQWSLPDVPVKVANYELINRDQSVFSDGRTGFDLVILDESQRIKNRATSISQAVRSIRRRRSWALTGTPVENSAEDLVGIFEFLSPGYLSSQMRPRRLGRLAGDYCLRRNKEQVLTELPPKMFRDADIQLTAAQRESYRLAEEGGVLRLTEMGPGVTIQHVFELVLRLKQICNFDPATGESAKLGRLEADLEEVAASGQKAIVFSQWVQTLSTLSERLARFRPMEFHGRVPSRKRDQVINRFRDDPNSHVLLISYGAGGVGLNLQFCGYVFLFDRWWNPAVEDQAVNRAHRIGAAGPVTVTRLLALATIEERIDEVLRQKRELFDTIFSDVAPHKSQGLSQEEIFGLSQLKTPGGRLNRAA